MNILKSREEVVRPPISEKGADEGGCGVVGCASSVPIVGKHFLTALEQMKNRGNGKGGGVAILGLNSSQWNVPDKILKEDFIIQVAILDRDILEEMRVEFIDPIFEVHHTQEVPKVDDFAEIGLEVAPPDIIQYFVRVREERVREFMEEHGIKEFRKAEEEIIYRNTFKLNTKYYASMGKKQAFVLSHAKNLVVFKIVGYADQVIRYYKLEEIEGLVWVGHHRYPTKGTVWHPGGAHPFIGMNEALVHNGDFSNYHAVTEYLAQRRIYPLFLTDTEVAALQFDLYSRVYGYSTEHLIEAIAPTTERDFTMLPPDKQRIYRRIQQSHIHGSPDGPWFFIIGRSRYWENKIDLLGITDTSMLRPQVFAHYEHDDVAIGLVGSERQAIDATLRSLSIEDKRFASKADRYWNARGGSYTDGGAFLFSVDISDSPRLTCTDKFGKEIQLARKEDDIDLRDELEGITPKFLDIFENDLPSSFMGLSEHIERIQDLPACIDALTEVLDKWHLMKNSEDGRKRGAVENALNMVFRRLPLLGTSDTMMVRLDRSTFDSLRKPEGTEKRLAIDIKDFDAEGNNSAARAIVKAYQMGWRHIYTFDWRGQRFCGSGLGPSSHGLRIDVYGNPGDYLASGLDGAEIYVHCSAQDQVGQMMKSGKLVIYGDVGQTFLYGAKGGEIYVLGNTAGRPLINAVGRPRVVINGTSLDYLGESLMSGNPLNGGGFVILNALRFEHGKPVNLDIPYPGGNLMSLASGGAAFILDPFKAIEKNQMHGSYLCEMNDEDIAVVMSYLKKNEVIFGFLPEPSGYVKVAPSKLAHI